ncbi:uncharacterized protein [Henckelia pumila]|uniref:uncharacterized protein isoform X2 n=1 Tax=Henckelia pumila TaxID=405737 RepID=UPI003C6E9E13
MAIGKGPTLVYAIITVLGIAALGLSIAGDRLRNAGSLITDFSDESYCVYEAGAAHGLATGACSLLLCSQVVLMVATSCLCCGSRLAPGISRACTIVFFILSWISFLIAEACLMAAAKDNWYDNRYGNDNSKGISCSTLRKALFVAGAMFVVSTTILNVFYYMCFTQASRKHINVRHTDYPASSTVARTPSG